MRYFTVTSSYIIHIAQIILPSDPFLPPRPQVSARREFYNNINHGRVYYIRAMASGKCHRLRARAQTKCKIELAVYTRARGGV